MALTPRLDLRQSQSLVMTPQLQQAIKLLALSSLEIEAFIAEAVEKNPLLEIGSSEDTDRRKDNAGEEPPGDAPAASTEGQASDTALGTSDMSASEALDMDIRDGGDNDAGGGPGSADGMLSLSSGGAAGAGNGEFGDSPDFDSFAAADLSLRDHLLAQAGAAFSGRMLFLVQQLIDQIEATGYLGADLLATAHRLGVDMAEMESALAALQCFDPTGVGARNLAECIALTGKGSGPV